MIVFLVIISLNLKKYATGLVLFAYKTTIKLDIRKLGIVNFIKYKIQFAL